jgi:PKD repeat protein
MEPSYASAYGKDGSCWVAETQLPFGHVLRLSKDGIQLAQVSAPMPGRLITDQTDGSVWMLAEDPISLAYAVDHFSSTGQLLSSWGSYQLLDAFDYNPHDNTFWLGNNAPSVEVIHAAADGTQLSVTSGFTWVLCAAANSTDDSCWVADVTGNAVVHLGPDGKQITRLTGFDSPLQVMVDPADGSVWVAEFNPSQNPWTAKVSHLTAGGQVLWTSSGLVNPVHLALNHLDRSLWVTGAGSDGRSVLHLAADGTELWRGTDFASPAFVNVDPADGSVWVCDWAGEVTHLVLGLHADFTASPATGPAPLAVQFADKSVGAPTSWSWDFGDGDASTGQSPSHQYTKSGIYTVTLTVGDATHTETTTKARYLQVTPVDVTASFWAEPQIAACVDAGIVAGYPDGTYHPEYPVTRDQMAVYISRALAGGDAGVPSGPATPSFTDVPVDNWAYRYIEYAKAQDVVQGYSDGTYKPTEQVTRDQMAVYIARAVVSPTGDAGLASYTPPATPDFPDVLTNFWAYKYIEYCKSHMIVQGFPDGTYHPEYVVTRDQMAVYIQRAFQLPLG